MIPGWVRLDPVTNFPKWNTFQTTVPPIGETGWIFINRPECECTTTSSTSTSTSTSTSSSTTSSTTTLPPEVLRVQLDNTSEEIPDLVLTSVNITYNNTGAIFPFPSTVDLSTTPFFDSEETGSADLNQDVGITFTNGSDANLTVNVYETTDANPESLVDSSPLGTGAVYNQTFFNLTATYFLTYRLEFLIDA